MTSWPSRRMRVAAASLAVVAAVAFSACGVEIGDECTYNTDCDPEGKRTCDASQPGGYCTIEGCDRESNACPEEATCVRFFPVLDMTKPCSPTQEVACSDRSAGCDPLLEPQCCRCSADEECISEGFCIRRDLERRNCMLSCGSDDDCRDGYRCYATGVGGAEQVPLADGTMPSAARFCAPAR